MDRVFRDAKIPSSGTVKYEDFVKNFYIEPDDIGALSMLEIDQLRHKLGIKVRISSAADRDWMMACYLGGYCGRSQRRVVALTSATNELECGNGGLSFSIYAKKCFHSYDTQSKIVLVGG